MAKATLMSIKPQWVAKILNGEKTIEIRKKFPKDYVGWVYIYCTKDKLTLSKYFYLDGWSYDAVLNYNYAKQFDMAKETLNGKVIARFWCDKVEEHRPFFHWCIEKETCLTRDDVLDYLDSKDKFVGNPKRQGKVYAIHITNLEIFDKPKELSEFYKVGYGECAKPQGNLREKVIANYNNVLKYQLTRAPQSWCYIYE